MASSVSATTITRAINESRRGQTGRITAASYVRDAVRYRQHFFQCETGHYVCAFNRVLFHQVQILRSQRAGFFRTDRRRHFSHVMQQRRNAHFCPNLFAIPSVRGNERGIFRPRPNGLGVADPFSSMAAASIA